MRDALRIALLGYRGNMFCGGQGIYLWHLARELSRSGHHVDVWVGPPYPDRLDFAERTFRVVGHQFWGKWFRADRRGFLPPRAAEVFGPAAFYELAASWIGFLPEPALFSLRGMRGVLQEMRRGRRYDLVHDVQSLGYGLLGLRSAGVPVVSTVHHPLTVDRVASFRRDRTLRDAIGTAKFFPVGMQAFVARRIDRILTSSEDGRRKLSRDFRVPASRVANVANGFDTERFRPAPQARAEGELLCVARSSDPNKGVRDLVEALARLPSAVRLTLVDDDGPSNPARIWARKLGCGDRLAITGRLDEAALVEAYRRATLVVVPSHHEGFGLPAVEALACGTPVVATDGGALPEVLGLVGAQAVPKGNREALAAAIARLLARPETRAMLGKRGADAMPRAFGWPAVAARTVGVYREVLAETGVPARITTSAPAGQ